MRDDMDDDFCDRLPGQHLGRLSLELQAKEHAEWQRRIDELEGRLKVAEDTICELIGTQTPAAGESPTSPEPAQAHGLTPPATPSAAGEEWRHLEDGELIEAGDETDRSVDHWRDPVKWEPVHPADIGQPAPDPAYPAHRIFRRRVDSSAAVGASEPGAGPFFAHKRIEFLEDRIKQQGRQIAELIDQLDVKDDSISKLILENDRLTKLNHHLREAAVMAIVERVPSDSKPTNVHNPESEDTPPHKQVIGPVVGTATVKPFRLEYGKRYVRRDGRLTGKLTTTTNALCWHRTHRFCDAVAGLTFTEDGHFMSKDETSAFDLIAEYHEPESQPAESPDDWVTQDRVAMRECDQFRWIDTATDLPVCNPLGEWGDVASPVRHVSHGFIDSEKYRLEVRCRRKDLPQACTCPTLDGVPVTGSSCPIHGFGMTEWDDAAPADKPRMRQVTLREYQQGGVRDWTSSGVVSWSLFTGRTVVVEVPE